MSPALRQFYQEYVITDPDNPENRDYRPIFPALESFIISYMTRDYHDIVRRLRFEKLSDFLDLMAETYRSDPAFVFMTINRDLNGNRNYVPHPPLPGAPELRTIFDLEDPEPTMSAADWSITPVRFLLHFRPLIQELISEDSGVEE